MKNNYMNALAYDFIKNDSYMPVKDKNGNYALYSWRKVLQRKEKNTVKILEIIDGDDMNLSRIQSHVLKNQKWIERLKEQNRKAKVIDIFVFNDLPDPDKEELLLQYGNGDYCMIIVDLNAETSYCNKDAFSDRGYHSKTKKNFSKKDSIEFEDVDKIYQLVNDYKLEIMRDLMPSKMTTTYSLIIINASIFLLEYIVSSFTGTDIIKEFGIKYSPYIVVGEYWRLVTPMFLHADMMHLASNMFALYILGQTVEKIYGSGRMMFIYFIGGLMGNVFSFAFTQNPSLGASGAVFAVGGAIVLIWKKKASRMLSASGRDFALVALIAINIVMGFANAGIDNWAHLGGLIGGFFMAYTLGFKNHRLKSVRRILCFLVFITIAGLVFVYGHIRWINYINSIL